MDNFEGKVAVITGAGSGFGREFARLGTKLGMRLVLADVQQDALDETFAEVSAAGAQAIARRVDVAKGEEIDALARATLDAFGGVLGAVPVLRTDGDCEGASQSSVRTGQRHATDLIATRVASDERKGGEFGEGECARGRGYGVRCDPRGAVLYLLASARACRSENAR